MDTEGINHPLLGQLNLSCKYSVERTVWHHVTMVAKVLDHNNHSLLTAVLKKNLNFQHVLWASTSLVLLAWDNYLLILGIREIGGNEVACPCWTLTILLTELQSPSVTN